MAVLAEYHATLGELIDRFEGTLERFTGDGLMVFFNDPLPCDDPAERAVAMAVAMRDRVAELAVGWGRRSNDLGFGIGIAQGYAARPDRVRGTIGLCGDRQRHEPGRTALRRRRPRADPRRAAHLHGRRGLRLRRARRRARVEGVQPADQDVRCERHRRTDGGGEDMTAWTTWRTSTTRPGTHDSISCSSAWRRCGRNWGATSTTSPSWSCPRCAEPHGLGRRHPRGSVRGALPLLLLLLRQPRLRMIYVTSLPVDPRIIEYYLALLPG